MVLCKTLRSLTSSPNWISVNYQSLELGQLRELRNNFVLSPIIAPYTMMH